LAVRAKHLAGVNEMIEKIKQQKGVSLIQIGTFNKEGSIVGVLLLKKQSFNTITSVHTTFSVVNLAEVKEVAVAYYFFICNEDKGTDFYAGLISKDLGEAGCIFKIVKSGDELISTLSAL
jgi:hypothetical protein